MTAFRRMRWFVYGVVIVACLAAGGGAWAEDAAVQDSCCAVGCCGPCYSYVSCNPCYNWGCYTPCYPYYGCCGSPLFGFGFGFCLW